MTVRVGLKVCAYYRMSSDEQKLSIEQQMIAVRNYCKQNGWVITKEYADAGKSGSKNIDKRTGFLRMVADAAKGLWQAIVCWDTSRFGRLDAIDSAPYTNALRRFGVTLETCSGQSIDWRTSTGRITSSIFQEADHEYSQKLSANAIRGRTAIAEAGYWAHGHCPYGYDREYVENGESRGVHPRTKVISKGRNWRTKLRINEAEAKVVRSIFERFANEDISVRGLAIDLNKKKVPSPGKMWMPQQLRHIFKEQAYIGNSTFGFGRRIGEAFRRVEQRVVKGACPSIIDRELWDKCQAKIAKRKQTKRNSSQDRSGALSGVLICGHCGYPMHCHHFKHGTTYVCSSGKQRQHLGCKYYSVREDEILPVICEQLFKAVDAELLNKINAQFRPQAVKKETAHLEAEVAKLQKKYNRASENLLEVDRSLLKELQAKVLELKSELDCARNSLALLKSDGGSDAWQQLHQWWEGLKLGALGEGMLTIEAELPGQKGKEWKEAGPIHTTPEALRHLLKTINAKMVLHWNTLGNRYYRLATGVITSEVSDPATTVSGDASTTSRWPSPATARADSSSASTRWKCATRRRTA